MPPRRPQQSKKKPLIKTVTPAGTLVADDDVEAADKFKVELQWCVQQLEAAMKKASLKEREDMAKAHKTLTSSKAQHIKKRQVMSSLFGDYRSKMAQEESKIKIENPKLKKSAAPPNGSVFYKKSAVHSSNKSAEPSTNSSEPVLDKQGPAITTSNPDANGSTSGGLNEEVKPSDSERANIAGNEDLERPEKVASPFKFTQSGNAFKFNFLVS